MSSEDLFTEIARGLYRNISSEERITALLDEIVALRGLIPKNRQPHFLKAGIRLPRFMYASTTSLRAPCPVLVKGRQCKNRCGLGLEMCTIHRNALERAKPDKTRCTAITLKGTQCKCKVFKSLEMCKVHAMKENLIPEPPEECAICYERMSHKDRKETRCGHYFHTECLCKYAAAREASFVTRRGKRETHIACPMCREQVKLRMPVSE
jgi:hypothetical protein